MSITTTVIGDVTANLITYEDSYTTPGEDGVLHYFIRFALPSIGADNLTNAKLQLEVAAANATVEYDVQADDVGAWTEVTGYAAMEALSFNGTLLTGQQSTATGTQLYDITGDFSKGLIKAYADGATHVTIRIEWENPDGAAVSVDNTSIEATLGNADTDFVDWTLRTDVTDFPRLVLTHTSGPVGLITPLITPARAATLGAKVTIDSGLTEYPTGVAISVITGSHTVHPVDVPNLLWDSPESLDVVVSLGKNVDAPMLYTAARGGLIVNLLPNPAAITAGAQWRMNDETAWRDDGDQAQRDVGDLRTAPIYHDATNYTTPTPATVMLEAGEDTTVNTTYVLTHGNITRTLAPAGAITAGARFRVDGGAWLTSTATVNNLSAGAHLVEYKNVIGWDPPADENPVVSAGATDSATGTYTASVGVLKVNIDPAAAVTAGGMWGTDGATYPYADGEEVDLADATYTVYLKPISGWTATGPHTSNVVEAGTTTVLNVVYTLNGTTGNLLVNALPSALQGVATWTVDGGATNPLTGASQDLAAGTKTLVFSAQAGYTKPADETVEVEVDKEYVVTGTYVADATDPPGQILFDLQPPDAQATATATVDSVAYTNGQTAILTPGTYAVTYGAVAGFTTPTGENVEVSSDTTVTHTAIWVPLAAGNGNLTVTLSPAAAVTGETWSVDAGVTPRASGATVALPVSANPYTIAFSSNLSTYDAPEDFDTNLTDGVDTEVTGTYTPINGQFKGTIAPAGAIAGGGYTLTGAAPFTDSGETITVLAAQYSLSAKPQSGWIEPASKFVTVPAGDLLSETITYTAAEVGLNVLISGPSGSAWQVANEAWRDSGEAITLDAGEYWVTFLPVAGYRTPEPIFVELSAGEERQITVGYVADAVLDMSGFVGTARIGMHLPSVGVSSPGVAGGGIIIGGGIHGDGTNGVQNTTEFWNREPWQRDPSAPSGTTPKTRIYTLTTDESGDTVTLSIRIDRTLYSVEFLDNASVATVQTAFDSAGLSTWTISGEEGSYTITTPLTFNDDLSITTTTSDGVVFGTDFDGVPPTSTTYQESDVLLYKIEVYGTDGLMAEINQVDNGTFTDRVNEASDIQFRVTADPTKDASQTEALMDPNARLVLRDRWGLALGAFTVEQPMRSNEGDAFFIDVYAANAVVQMGREVIPFIETSGTVQSVLEEIIADQVHERPVSIGIIDPQIEAQVADVKLVDTNILAVIRQMQKSIGKENAGVWWVDAENKFNWRRKIEVIGGPDAIAAGERLVGLEAREDRSELANRIHGFGEGDIPEKRLSLVDAGYATGYIQDDTSVAAYGIREFILTDSQITDPDILEAAVLRALEEFKDPFISYRLNTLDLSMLANDVPGRTGTTIAVDLTGTNTAWDLGFNGLYKGQVVQVLDADQDVDTEVQVLKVRYDIGGNPLPIEMELDNRRGTMEDIIEALINRSQPGDITSIYNTGEGGVTLNDPDDPTDPDVPATGSTRITENGFEFWNGDWWERGIEYAIVTGIQTQYLECVRYDVELEQATGIVMNVAPSLGIWIDSYNGVARVFENGDSVEYTSTTLRHRDAVLDGVTEDQVITPGYYIGDRLAVTRRLTDFPNVPWVEITQEARGWAAV